MGRLETARDNHITRWVLPTASRLLIEAACKDAPIRNLDEVAHIEMGQSPSGESCNQDGDGIPLIGGPSDLGLKYPDATRWTNQPTKLCRDGDIIVCVRATIGEPRRADGVYCLGRGVAGLHPLDSNLDSRFLFRIIEGNEDWLRSQGTGTTFKTISKLHLARIKVPIIPKHEQEQISSFLEWLEDSSINRPDFSNCPALPKRLSEQRRIVAKIEGLAAKVKEAFSLRDIAGTETRSLFHSSVTNLCHGNKYPIFTFGKVLLEAKNGIYKPPHYWGRGIPCVRMYNIDGPGMNKTNLQYLDVTKEELDIYGCKPGDLIFNRVNSAELVGKTGIITENYSPCTFESKNMRLRVDLGQTLPEFAVLILNSIQTKRFYRDVLKQQCGMATLNQNHVSRIPFPLPPLDEQRRIVAYLDGLQTKVDALKKLQVQTAVELDALLPAILDRAFKGEL